MLSSIFKKPHHPQYHVHASIDAFRTSDFRVFYANPFFSIDLFSEVKWHSAHLKKLKGFVEHPKKFHAEHHGRDPDENEHYFKEHVLDSIPFHEKILADHVARISFLRGVMSSGIYRKLVKTTRLCSNCPDFFVYDKKNKRYFFVIDVLTPQKHRWKLLVKDKYRICDVVILQS